MQIVLVRYRHGTLILEQRGVGGSEGRVWLDSDALGLSGLNELRSVIVEVQLELAGSGEDGRG